MTAMIDHTSLTWERVRIPLVIGLLALIPPVLFDPGATYQSRLFILVLVFGTLGMALNIVFGHTDQLFLFTGALTGIGAYGTAITADWLGVSPWMTFLVGSLVAGVLGLVVCYTAARRRFTIMLIAILTLALQLAIVEAFVGASDITGGSTGFRAFEGMTIGLLETDFGIHEHVVLYYLVLAILGATMVFYHFLTHSKYGLAFSAIRQDEIAAEAVGVDVVRYKSLAGFVSAFIIGLVGPFYATVEPVMLPGLFEFTAVDVLVLILLVIGGIRTMIGPIVGAAVLIYLREQLATFGQWRSAVYGLLLIVLFLYFRQGIVPAVDRLLNDHLGLRRRLGTTLRRDRQEE